MIKKLSPKFIKYVIAGLSTLLLDSLTLIAIKEFFGLSASLAVITNQIIVWIYNFLINKYLTFGNNKLPHKQFIRYIILASCNYLLAIGVMYLLSDRLGVYYLWVRLGTIACMTMWNYFIYKVWVYAD